ncbi:hypothetical protein LLG95_03505 [bacterium]|nr:hypothetical protein [bacterium]
MNHLLNDWKTPKQPADSSFLIDFRAGVWVKEMFGLRRPGAGRTYGCGLELAGEAGQNQYDRDRSR